MRKFIWPVLVSITLCAVSACSLRSTKTVLTGSMAPGFTGLGTMDIEQFELSAFSYREGASAPTGKSAKGGCGCN